MILHSDTDLPELEKISQSNLEKKTKLEESHSLTSYSTTKRQYSKQHGIDRKTGIDIQPVEQN